ncbi:MAG: 50S ribosomal protein L22 [Candidatus Omnitrophica bacterium]|nr:50S ribosomal protein L22 [Candidatus Omnitrophota bacterium]
MIAKATAKYVRISPKKARLVTRVLKGMPINKAYAVLGSINKKSSAILYKLLKSAFNNAQKKDSTINEADLYISKIVADSGPMLKRHRAMSMGRAGMIRKRTSHITVNLDMHRHTAIKREESKKTKKMSIFRKRQDKKPSPQKRENATSKDNLKKKEAKKK